MRTCKHNNEKENLKDISIYTKKIIKFYIFLKMWYLKYNT